MACLNLRTLHMAQARERGTHTDAEWRVLLDDHNHMCAYCGTSRAVAKDHIVPISRGGSNAIENIAPACASCNSRKASLLLSEFVDRLRVRST